MRFRRMVRGPQSVHLGPLGAALTFVPLTAAADGQETTRVSVDSSGVEGNHVSEDPAISADGLIVAFKSYAWNLVASDTNGTHDIFVHDRSTGITERVSVDSSGAESDGLSHSAAISADGQIVAFTSIASNLVAGDTNGYDVFIHDRSTGVTERVSVDSSGVEGDDESFGGSLSADGRIALFTSYAANLVSGDWNGAYDAFVHDRSTGITERVSVDSAGAEGNRDSYGGAISGDGRFVVFSSYATNLVAGDTNGFVDVLVHDRSTGTTERVSVDGSGAEGNGDSWGPAISADAQIVAFRSAASNLVVGDTNRKPDVFVHDRSTGATVRVSVDSLGNESNGSSNAPALSGNGQIVAFQSDASNLVLGDTNGLQDVFVHDRSSGVTERASMDSSGVEGNDTSAFPTISADGLIVGFSSYSTNLVAGDKNGQRDVFIHERCEVDATWSNYGAGFPGTNGVPSITLQSDPILGTTLTVDVGNSYGQFTVGLLFIGFQRTQIPTNWGGDLLVVPEFTILFPLTPGGASISADIPADEALCGFIVDLQAIENDPGAARGVSFTPGLELVIGH